MPEPYLSSPEQVLEGLRTDGRIGLTLAEARERLEHFGRNELPREKPKPAWRKFLAQFRDVLVILLLLAAGVSALLWWFERHHAWPYEATAIIGIVLLNAVMGYLQQSRAEAAVEKLRAMTTSAATVQRDGQRQRVASAEIVPGDLLVLEEGDTVSADGRIVHSSALRVAEAALTGESLPTEKQTRALGREVPLGDRTNMVFAGTAVSYGRGLAVITATGANTEMGRIAHMLRSTPDPETPLQRELDRVGKRLGLIVVVIAIVMIGTIIIAEHVRGLAALFDVLILGVALAVAAVPEGLPAIVTAVLALGVRRMATRNAIVRHLAAVETLGSSNVIASDKTGTLTKNEMTVRVVLTPSGRADVGRSDDGPASAFKLSGEEAPSEALKMELRHALTAADRANNAVVREVDGQVQVQGDPTEAALLIVARSGGVRRDELDRRFRRVGEIPFSSERKLMSTLHADTSDDARVLCFTKGAADVLLPRCSREQIGDETRALSDERRRELLRINDNLAGEALRTLALASRTVESAKVDFERPSEDLEQGLVFLGLVGMIDPPRDEARAAVARARGAGIRPVMITGDHAKTAAVIARDLGIASDGRVLAGVDIERMSEADLARVVADVSVYARVDPNHKLRIVGALKAAGATVAMTGDGVNDAPALKTADIGIAMGITGTDVAKEAADVVLTDDNFATIVAAVEEGRAIFANIRKFLRYLLSSNIGEVMTMFFGVLLGKVIGLPAVEGTVVLPLLATQILWINLVTDGAPALALGVDPSNDDVMRQPPRPRDQRVITSGMWGRIFLIGAVMAIGTLFMFDACLPHGLVDGDGDLRYAQTMAFTTLMAFQLFNVFNARSDHRSVFVDWFSNRWLWGAVTLSALLHVAVIYVPFLQNAFSTVSLGWRDWMLCVTIASSVLWVSELVKLAQRILGSRRLERAANG